MIQCDRNAIKIEFRLLCFLDSNMHYKSEYK